MPSGADHFGADAQRVTHRGHFVCEGKHHVALGVVDNLIISAVSYAPTRMTVGVRNWKICVARMATSRSGCRRSGEVREVRKAPFLRPCAPGKKRPTGSCWRLQDGEDQVGGCSHHDGRTHDDQRVGLRVVRYFARHAFNHVQPHFALRVEPGPYRDDVDAGVATLRNVGVPGHQAFFIRPHSISLRPGS